MGSFSDTVTLESPTDLKQTKKTHKKTTVHFRGAPWISNFETYLKLQAFLFLFSFMENEHLNLNHPQCFCDLIALLGTVS